MTYRIAILVDGSKIDGYRWISFDDLEYCTELSGPNLFDFGTALKLTGKAMDVERTPDGVRVVIAHEEI